MWLTDWVELRNITFQPLNSETPHRRHEHTKPNHRSQGAHFCDISPTGPGGEEEEDDPVGYKSSKGGMTNDAFQLYLSKALSESKTGLKLNCLSKETIPRGGTEPGKRARSLRFGQKWFSADRMDGDYVVLGAPGSTDVNAFRLCFLLHTSGIIRAKVNHPSCWH